MLVCQNERAPDNPKGCCASKGAARLLERLKELAHAHGLKGQVRVTGSGCLDLCSKGCAVVVFSADPPGAETWYGHLKPADADALFEAHILRGERLAGHVESQ